MTISNSSALLSAETIAALAALQEWLDGNSPDRALVIRRVSRQTMDTKPLWRIKLISPSLKLTSASEDLFPALQKAATALAACETAARGT